MFGKPMISSEIGTGTSYINIHNDTGLVVPPGNPDALSQAMSRLWNNSGAAEVMGRNAEKRYYEYFTSEKMINSYMQVYSNLLSRES